MSPDNWSFSSPIDANNTRSLYGPSVFDIRHRFTYTFTYAVPGIKAPAQLLEGTNLGCYANGNSILIPPAFGSHGTLGRNVFRSMPYYNWDFSVTKAWKFKERVRTQFRAEFFNVLNHPNISNPFGGPGGDNSFTDPSGTRGASFGFRPETPDVTSSNPVLGSGGARAIQLGLKIIF
jgi:hypothetical protein